ncbi:hypothetical protein GOODEAATRI_031658 [Goodea atripinnis]|uniref:Uncharacterized protein n=1 Tax=Goodea atripinnis TaxID=208336 RepID=A0ABV0PT92_9TELE
MVRRVRLLAGITLALGDFRQLLGRSSTRSNLQVIENAARTSHQCNATPYFAVAGDALCDMFPSKIQTPCFNFSETGEHMLFLYETVGTCIKQTVTR